MLAFYDLWVHDITTPLIWRCPKQRLLQQYRQNLRDRHLEAGVGTADLLHRARFPGKKPRIMLLDLNEHTLEHGRRKLARYAPRQMTANLLAPIAFDEQYDSVALNYVLHCLPGTMREKAAVFGHLKRGLAPGGVLFGATILG